MVAWAAVCIMLPQNNLSVTLFHNMVKFIWNRLCGLTGLFFFFFLRRIAVGLGL